MTISSDIRTAGPFTGTGLVSVYAFAFKVFAAAEVVATSTNTSGVLTTLTQPTHYTVTLNSNQNTSPGGTITLAAPLASGFRLEIGSEIAATQGASLPNQGGWFPAVVEDALDRLTILAQQMGGGTSNRNLRVPELGGIDALPSISDRAGKLMSFNGITGAPEAVAAADQSATQLAIDLASTAAGDGAAMLGVQDAAAYWIGLDQEAVNAEIGAQLRRVSVSLESIGFVSGDATAYLQTAIALPGVTEITCDTDCTLTAAVSHARSDLHIRMRCALTYAGAPASVITDEVLAGVIGMIGALSGSPITRSTTAAIAEGDDTIQLSSVAEFAVGDIWRIRPAASEWGPLSYIVEITKVDSGANTISIGYKIGWPISSGVSYVFEKVITPVRRSSIYIKELIYSTAEPGTNGVAGIAEQYTIDCDSVIGTARNIKWPAVLKRWSIGGVAEAHDVRAPQDITTGGMGYGVHNIHCLYSATRNVRTAQARHAIDWSGCAHCTADEIHDSQQLANTTSFSCHQAYDHDCTLSNFSGWLSWANDPVFGQSMKRMAARDGIAKGQLATFFTSPDCTFENIRVFGDIIINADGATLTNVAQSNGTTRFNQTSTLSARGTTEINSCNLSPWLGGDWIPVAVTAPINFNNGRIGPMNSSVMRGSVIVANDVQWYSSSTPGQSGFVYTTDLQINGGTHSYNAWRVLGTASKVTVNGGSLLAFNDTANGFLDCRIAAGTLRAKINALVADASATTNRLILWTGSGGTLKLSCTGLTAESGAVEINSSIGASGYVAFDGTATIGTSYTRPSAGARVAYSGELLL